MHSPDEFTQKGLLVDFFISFSETCFFDLENPKLHLDLISKMCARYEKDCSYIFSTLYQLNEEHLLSAELISQILQHPQLTAHQLYKTLNIIHEQKLQATDFRQIAIIQMCNIEQKKIIDKCCHLELFHANYSEKLCYWIYKAPSSPLLNKLLNKSKLIENDLTGIVEYAENFPIHKKFHVFIGITILEQFIEMDSSIVKLFDSCEDPLMLTELLLQANILELIKGPQKELNLELILNSATPELMFIILYHIKSLDLSPEIELMIKNKIAHASFAELGPLRNTLDFLQKNPDLIFSNWQELLQDLPQSFEMIQLYTLLSKSQAQQFFPGLLVAIKTIPVALAREMLQQMLMMYPHYVYHQHFFQYALPVCKEPNLSFHLYLRALNKKIYFYHLPPESVFKLFFGANNSVLLDLFLEYKKNALLPENNIALILTPEVLELLEKQSVQQAFKFIHCNEMTKEFISKQHPKSLVPLLECLRILKESNLLEGYNAIKNLKLLSKTQNIHRTAHQLKQMIIENSVCQENFEHSITLFPSLFKNSCRALTEQHSAKALSKF